MYQLYCAAGIRVRKPMTIQKIKSAGNPANKNDSAELKKIMVISAGGTISQRASGGEMVVDVQHNAFHESLDAETKDVEIVFKNLVDTISLAVTSKPFQFVFQLRDLIKKKSQHYDGFIITMGTDYMAEIAYALDILLDPKITVLITGSMRPSGYVGYDGYRNFRDSVAFIKYKPEHIELGTCVVMLECLHPARYVRKIDSQSMNAFQSYPGPMAQIRIGKPEFFYEKLPEIQRFENTPTYVEELLPKVALVNTTFESKIDADMYQDHDALILVGCGTGTIPISVWSSVKELAERITVAITTKCQWGANYDDHYYLNSLSKYEDKGFLVEKYRGLSDFQVKIQITFELLQNNKFFEEKKCVKSA